MHPADEAGVSCGESMIGNERGGWEPMAGDKGAKPAAYKDSGDAAHRPRWGHPLHASTGENDLDHHAR